MNFKKILLIFSLLYATFSISQITTTKIEVKEKVKEQKVYDRKSDFEYNYNSIYHKEHIEDYKQYIGQKVYTKKGFLQIYLSTGEYCENCQSKYFTIKDVTTKKIRVCEGERCMQENDVFELVNDENGETYYYSLEESNNLKSLILVSYFLDQKKTYENKKYYIVSYYLERFENEATNEWVNLDKPLYGGEWNCEVSVLEETGSMAYIMKNASGEIISSKTVGYHDFGKFYVIKKISDKEGKSGICFMSVDDYNSEMNLLKKGKKDEIAKNKNIKLQTITKLTPKYGKEKAVLISNGKVEIGMTRQMCVDSWGVPLYSKILKTKKGSTETLLYNWNKKLYLENGILAKIEY